MKFIKPYTVNLSVNLEPIYAIIFALLIFKNSELMNLNFYLGSIIGYNKAIQAGLLPFIPSELFKIALAVILIPTLNKILK